MRIPLSHDLNIEAWHEREYLLPDKSLVDMLAFGFPAEYSGTAPPVTGLVNHSSCLRQPLSRRQVPPHRVATWCDHWTADWGTFFPLVPIQSPHEATQTSHYSCTFGWCVVLVPGSGADSVHKDSRHLAVLGGVGIPTEPAIVQNPSGSDIC